MRFKLIGAGMILLASAGIIFSKEAEFSEHKRQLEEFGLLLSLLQNEICLLRLPLPLVLEHCRMHLHPPYRRLCETVREKLLEQSRGDAPGIWRAQVEENRRTFLLDDAECRLLAEAGEVLRMDNVEFKEELFGVYQERLNRLRETYETNIVQRRRLCRYGTVLAGIFLIIFFI
ncbi:MAG: stage III sporulation protein AB [Lachnospiraceae bacterium]|nr:stage III sporulation protein AB [Lachnospiraceae bacterium]